MESSPSGDLAIVLSGGGARAAYQIGLLRCLGRLMPEVRFPIITGVSAGAINAVFLAAHPGTTAEAAEDLSRLWGDLEVEDVFRADGRSLTAIGLRWLWRLVSGGGAMAPTVKSLVDTSPLRALIARAVSAAEGEIEGIGHNLGAGWLKAVAVTAVNYATGQTVTWVEGRGVEGWQRPNRRGVPARLRVEHVMASAALPLLFPAVEVDGTWYGDGGIRLLAPLSPSLHLGASRILAVSTRYRRTAEEECDPCITSYPPPAQILGQLLNAIFLDVFDQDVERLERLNSVVRRVPTAEREGLKPVDILVLRPSRDLGRLAAQFEPRLPRMFRFLTRGLGTRETKSPDFLSLLMFQPDYLRELIAIGEADAEARKDEIAALIEGRVGAPARP